MMEGLEVQKRERKANFTSDELRALLEGIGQDRDMVMCKFSSQITLKHKKEAWGRILRAVNGCGNCLRTEEDLKKKWKDLKAAALREESDQKKTGGGGPMKEVPFRDLIFHIIGDRSAASQGIQGKPY